MAAAVSLLKRPLTLADVKRMLVGHWGTTPGQNFIYVHLNRVIKKYDLDMIYVSGPGHGGPAVVANTYLEGLKKLHRRIVIEFVANLRRPRPDSLKVVVAHFWTPLLGTPSPSKQI